ncbi:NB-ARC domain-containing protein [Streptomyces sp. NPDC059695]|uniref:NB-ARC domain-containing protein n=1 Tax=Streptomyces sp. NPDC059695 TaxID=3346910 RepID=UPI00368632FC
MTTPPAGGGFFDNTFNGPTPVQNGDHNQQINTFHLYSERPPPPAAPEVPEWWVADRDEVEQVVDAVCSPSGGPVGITTALEGAGGFGKTTVAQLVRASHRVRQHFRGGVYFFVVGRDVDSPQTVTRLVHDVILAVAGQDASFDNPDRAGEYLGQLLDQRCDSDGPTLLIFDDVWTQEQLAPLLVGGGGCVRLVTTRVPAILPSDARTVRVDTMPPDKARLVLTCELPSLPMQLIHDLVQVTGGWPLLLRLTNRLINRRVRTGADAPRAAADLLRTLREQGPAGVDKPSDVPDAAILSDPRRRATMVRATVEASTADLSADSRDRFAELGIFAYGEAVPISVVGTLWRATAGHDEWATRDLCADLADLSLLTADDTDGGRLFLHDVIRDYLRAELGPDRLAEHHTTLVDAVQAGLPPSVPLTPSAPLPPAAWWELTDGYLLDHAVAHLLAAHRTAAAEALACDLRWIETRLHHRGPIAPWADCARVPTPTAAQRARHLSSIAHLLGATEPAHALTAILHSRLQPLPDWRDQVTARYERWPHPALRNHWTPSDLPHPALLRLLTGHTAMVSGVAIAPDGTWLATASKDGTVRVWDRATGEETARLTGHEGEATGVAIAPDGTWLVTVGRDGTARIRDRDTGQETACLVGHHHAVLGVAVSPDGTWLATAGADATVRVWDRDTGRETGCLTGHRGWVGVV